MQDGTALIVELKVIPLSGEFRCFFDKSGTLKCRLKSAAQKGEANKELIKMLARTLKIEQAAITIITGVLDRKKRLKIQAPLSYDQFLKLLGIERPSSQLSLFGKP